MEFRGKFILSWVDIFLPYNTESNKALAKSSRITEDEACKG